MKKVTSYTLDDGTVVGIELDDVEERSTAARSISRSGDQAEQTPPDSRFATVVDKIPALTNAVFAALKQIKEPKEVELEMGIKLSAKTGVVIASADSEAHFKLKIKWQNGS
ncbi:MAG: hypothetical protein ACI8WB_005259 [Phenylobacterium sp.]|jgi:hypothetical protein